MIPQENTEWPLRYVDPWQSPLPLGGIAPLRQELALARYLEEQASDRAAAGRRFGLWISSIRLCTQMADFARDSFRSFRPSTGERRR